MLVVAASVAVGAGPALAAPISSDHLGVDGGAGTPAISMAYGNGLGVIRVQLIQGTNADPVVAAAAAAHLRIYPILGLRTQLLPGDAATAMALYVTSFAQRYGPGGTFWAEHPLLPTLPVKSYEIGNEPNIPPQYVADNTHLHWSGWPDPSDYALVYASARSALHAVDPSAKAVVGGLADSALPGVSLSDDEAWLAALTPGQVDAVGYHPYTFPVGFSTMYSDTQQLREWMDTHGMSGVPVDINEFGACDVQPQDTLEVVGCNPSIPSAQWGSFAAAFTQWALCSPQLNVENVSPEYWGDEANTDVNALLALVSSEGTLTPYGADYLGEAHTLTTSGCPPASPGSGGGSPPPVVSLASMRLQVKGVHLHGHRLTVLVHEVPRSGRITVVARKGHRLVRLHITGHKRHGITVFSGRLPAGRWKLTVACKPPAGYATPASVSRTIKI